MTNTLIIVDRSVTNHATRIAGFPVGSEVLLLTSDQDGLQQIAAYLDGKSGYDSIHILAVANSGTLSLGNSTLTSSNLMTYTDSLAQIGAAMTVNGGILFDDSKLAQGADGQAFVAALAQATGVTIKVSAPEIKLMRFDWAIKSILRDKANFDVLEGFFCALLGEEEITIEHVLESESNAEKDRKFNRVDLLVHDHLGRKFIIEVQNQRQADYLERLLFGTAKVIVENLPLGEAYHQLVKVISISILYFNLGVGDDYVYTGLTEFKGLHTGHPLKVRERVSTPEATFSYRAKNIFPEYYLINVERFEDIIQSPLDEWIYLLKHSAVRPEFNARNINKAAQKLALLRMTPRSVVAMNIISSL